MIIGCSSNDEVTKELINYYNNNWITVQKMKEEGIGKKRLELLRTEEEGNEKAGDFVEEEILPSMQEVLDYLHDVKLEHKENQKLHQLQVEAEEFFYKSLQDGAENYRGKVSDDEIYKNTDKLEEKYDAFLERRDELMKKYNIEWDEDSSENGYHKMKLGTEE